MTTSDFRWSLGSRKPMTTLKKNCISFLKQLGQVLAVAFEQDLDAH
jgi:hypothetical protein